MLSMRRLSAIIRKEFIELLRDRRTLAVMILMPVFQLIIFAFAVQSDLRHLPIGWVDADNSEISRALRDKFVVSEHFTLHDFQSREQAEQQLLSNKINAIAVIPTNFSKSVISGSRTEIQLLIDGTDPNLARNTTGYFQSMIGDFYIKRLLSVAGSNRGITQPLDIRLRVNYNEDLSTVRYMLPGLLAYILAFLALIITALTMVRELENGTFEQLFVTPVTRLEVLVGKLVPFGIVAIIVGTLIAIAGWLIFGVVPKGDILALYAIAIMFVLSMLSSGLFVSAISKTPGQATQVSVSITMPAMLLSGFMFPIFTMPIVYRILSNGIPLTFALIAFRGVYLKGWGLFECLPYIGILTLFVIIYLSVTVRVFNRRIG